MADIIVILIVIVLLGFALRGSVKHFKGDSPCCGGGGESIVLDIPDKKLEKPALGKKVLKISGMHCEHCAKAVMLIVISQLLIAYVIELYGMFGVERVPFSWRKVLGMLIAIAGIVIFKWEKL